MDKTINNLISVNICTYNRADFIEEAIKSALEQTYTNIEIIVTDDASTDNTKEIVESFNNPKIKYFKNETNLGISKNRDVALSKSSGEYIAVLDSDDFWRDKSKLEKQIAFLENNKNYAVIGTQTMAVTETGKFYRKICNKTSNKKIKNNLLLKNQFVNSSTLIRHSVINEVGKYNESLILNEDYDLFLKIGEKYQLHNLEEFSTSYRIGEQNTMNNKKVAAKVHHEIIKKYNDYPNYFVALIKSYLRILKSLI